VSANQRRISTKTFAWAAILVALLLAGAVSYYASSSPDGLNKVAQEQGFNTQERESAASDSPLAGYSTEQVENDRLSGAVAGVLGVGVVLVLAGGLALVLRRRSDSSQTEDPSAPVGRTPEGR
jgi:hypothetical protein